MNIGTLTGQIAIEDQVSSALTLIAGRVKNFAEGFDNSLGGVAIGLGAVVTGLVAVTAAITALGNRGSDVNDVANTLDRFAGSAENATEILAKMKEGTLGTVTNFDLMKSSAKLLAADVKLSAADFGTLSSAAFVLQNQGLGPTKQMLDMVSSALLTGRTRSIEMAIGKMDLTKAETIYARSLNKSEQDLNAVEKLEAKRRGILEALAAKVKEAGVQERDFGETLEFVVTKMKDWFDGLARMVSSSPHIQRAIDAIGEGFQKVFGGGSQTLMEGVAKGIDMIADAVVFAVPYIVSFADGLKSIYNFVVENQTVLKVGAVYVAAFATAWGVFIVGSNLVTGVVAGLAAIKGAAIAATGWFSPLAAAIAAVYAAYKLGQTAAVSDWFMDLGLKIQGYSAEERKAMIETDKQTQALITQQEELKKTAEEVADHAKAVANARPEVEKVVASYGELRAEAMRLINDFTPLTAQQKELVLLFEQGGMSADKIAEKLTVAAAAIKAFGREQAAMAENTKISLAQQASSWRIWANAVDEAGERAKNAIGKNFKDIRALQQELNTILEEATKSQRELAISAIVREGEMRKQALKDASDYTQEKYDLIDQIVQANLEKFKRNEEGMAQFSRKMYEDMARDAQTKLDEIATSSDDSSGKMIVHFESVRDTALKAADDFRNGFIAAAEDTKKVIGETAKEIIARTLSFSEALDAARRGEGTMSATVQAGGMFTASREETIKAWAEGRYYGPVDSMGMPDFRKIGPLRGDPQESRDSGGNVSAGRSYKIGSGVEEIFTPGQSGMVVPGGGGGTTVVLNAPNGFWGADRNQVARALEDVLSARQGVTQQYTRR